MSGEVDDARARLDALRRRLYRPDASEADRAEYTALEAQLARADAAAAPAPAAVAVRVEDPPPGDAPPVRRPRRLLAAGLAVAAVVVAAVGVAATRTGQPTATASSAPAVALTQNVNDGSFGAPAPSARPTPAPRPTPAILQFTGSTIAAQQTFGGGDAIVTLDTASAPPHGGTLVVLVSSSDPSPVGWIAERRANRADHTSYTQTVAVGPPALHQGRTPAVTAPYEGDPPTRLVMQAATGVGWTVTVAFAE